MGLLDRLVRAPAATLDDHDPAPASVLGETETVRRIAGRLAALPPARARFLAGFAYVVARAAHADLDISDEETSAMAAALVEVGDLDPAQALLVAEMAKLRAIADFGTEDYLVTRELAKVATPEEKVAVIRACFAVGAADDEISGDEAHTVNAIARELGVDRPTLNAVREGFVDRFSAIRAVRRIGRP